MANRPTKRRRLDLSGKHVQTRSDLSLRTKDSNSGYFLRSSIRSKNPKKRKFISPIKEVVEKENQKENIQINNNPHILDKENKLNKWKNKFTAAVSKAFQKPNNDNENMDPENKLTKKKDNEKSKKDKILRKHKHKLLQKNNDTQSKNKKYQFDDKGYIIFNKGLVINNRYIVQKRLGKGTFSKVFACVDSQKNVSSDSQSQLQNNCAKTAIKVIRNQHKYQVAARTELRILECLKDNDKLDEYPVIKLVCASYFEMHPIFIFPLYGRSLYHYLYDNGFRPFPDSHIKSLSSQVISAVGYVHSLGIIITDLKPENIIIQNDSSDRHLLGDGTIYYTLKNPSVKLIDFGSAIFDGNKAGKHGYTNSNVVHTHLIQTRHYRAPEVMFKFNWSYPADMWSVGCVIVELANGKMLFNTHDTIDHLQQLVNCISCDNEQDNVPNDIIQLISEQTYNQLFSYDGKLAVHRAKRSPVQATKLKSYFHHKYHKQLYNLVKQMLDWHPETRLTAENALKHSYFTKKNSKKSK